jgi:hypothetical protein
LLHIRTKINLNIVWPVLLNFKKLSRVLTPPCQRFPAAKGFDAHHIHNEASRRYTWSILLSQYDHERKTWLEDSDSLGRRDSRYHCI